MRVVSFEMHGAWEYEFTRNLDGNLTRITDRPIKEHTMGNFKTRRPLIYNIDYKRWQKADIDEACEDADAVLICRASDCQWVTDVKAPVFFVVHNPLNNQVEAPYNERFMAVHVCSKTLEGSNFTHNRVILNGVSPELYESCYDVAQTTPSIAGSCYAMPYRPMYLGYPTWREVTRGHKAIMYGPQNGIVNSDGVERVPTTIQEYSRWLIRHRVFLNTTQEGPGPMCLLDAMASGMPIVSTATMGIPEMVEHGVSGLLSNDVAELRGYVELLMHDDELCARLGRAARERVVTYLNAKRMVDEWTALFDSRVHPFYAQEGGATR